MGIKEGIFMGSSRLEAFACMLAAVQEEYAGILSKMEKKNMAQIGTIFYGKHFQTRFSERMEGTGGQL